MAISHDSPVYNELFPYFLSDSLFWVILFSSMFYLMPFAMTKLLPKYYNKFPDKKKADFISYICSFVHHVVVVPQAVYRMIFLTANATSAIGPFFSTYNESVLNEGSAMLLHCEAAPFSFGYLAADIFFYAIPEALQGRYEYIIHHMLGLCLFVIVPLLPVDVAPFCSRVLIMESTSICFTISYILRNTGNEKSIFVPIFEIAFVIVFFLIRVLNLVYLMYEVVQMMVLGSSNRDTQIFGMIITGVFVPILAMQLYWFGIIVKKSFERFNARKLQ